MGYHIIILPLFSLFFTQTLKIFISPGLKFDLKNFFAYSGMPSGHSALIVSLATITGFEEGFDSSIFAATLILAIIVIRDALGIRRYLGQHGKTLNVLVKDLSNDKVLDQNYPHHLEKIGHTPLQVVIGSLIGFFVSIIGFFLLS
jgi:hypothetical protein